MSNTIEVADIFRLFGPAYTESHSGQIPKRHLKAMFAIEDCRTSALGGHIDECDNCGALSISYNSCRNRHCPKCQSLVKERWILARKEELLPVEYFHVVFTLPEQLRPIALRNQKVIYNILFKAVSQTLLQLATDPKHLGAQIGFSAILHTWSQTMIHHPHIHCIVPGGGLSSDGNMWISTKKKDFLIHVFPLSKMFKGKFLSFLRKTYDSGKLVFEGKISYLQKRSNFKTLMDKLYSLKWNVNSKPSFDRPQKVLDYLSRYVHRVAISNDRILKLEGNQVTFRYWDSNQKKSRYMTLDAFEFIRRFLLHILPDNFVKIRHFGFLSNTNKKTKLLRCKLLLDTSIESKNLPNQQLTWQELLFKLTGKDPTLCPVCGKGKMKSKRILKPLYSNSPSIGEPLAA